MRPVNAVVLSGPDTATILGDHVSSDQLVSASFLPVFADTTAAGTLQVQASNDLPPAGNLAPFTPTNWSNITDATSAVTAGVGPLIFLPQICYRWIRITYTSTTPGTSTFKVNMFAFGV